MRAKEKLGREKEVHETEERKGFLRGRKQYEQRAGGLKDIR